MGSGEAAEKEDDHGPETQTPSSSSSITTASTAEAKGIQQSTTVFVFWAYFLGAVTLVTLLCGCFSSVFLPLNTQAEHFAMPPLVRQHLARGKLLKIELGQSRQPTKVFVREEAPSSNSNSGEECVVLLHGLGASSFIFRHIIPHMTSHGLRVIAMDFPGAGLSEKPLDRDGGFWDRLSAIYEEIIEKGVLWRFEQLFETGGFPDEQPTIMAREQRRLHYDAEDLADSVDQVLNLVVAAKPVHIVLHDWSVEAGLTWVAQNPTRVSSITIFDASPSKPSFPVEFLRVPLLGSIVTRSSLLHNMFLRACCVMGISHAESDSIAFLLRVNNGRETVLQTWKGTNSSFDVATYIESLPGHPVHVLWSKNAGLHWQKTGEMFALQVVNASSSSHHGSRWPQEDAGVEVAEHIHRFISSLPPTKHATGDEPLPHIQGMFNPTARDKHDFPIHGHVQHACNHGHGNVHEHGHQSHDHHEHEHGGHDHGLGYMDGMGLGGWIL